MLVLNHCKDLTGYRKLSWSCVCCRTLYLFQTMQNTDISNGGAGGQLVELANCFGQLEKSSIIIAVNIIAAQP